MKKIRRILALALVLAALLGMAAVPSAGAAAAYDYYYGYEGLIGAMEIVNCKSYASLRQYPDTSSLRVAQVPLGSVVTNCYYYDEKFTYCQFDGMEGYILNTNLSFLAGKVGFEYPDEAYLGNFEIVNCKSYASLRQYPDTSSLRVAQVPLGSIVTNVFYEDDKWCYCVFGDQEGYILNANLSWVSGGTFDAQESIPAENWLGRCVIINCISFASLRQYPDTTSTRLAKVPLGSVVTDCYIVDERFACCTYDGMVGYILLTNLGQ